MPSPATITAAIKSTTLSGFEDDGRILALVKTNANLGAFVSNFAPYIATECGAAMLSSVYAIPTIAFEVHGVFTNTVPVDAVVVPGIPKSMPSSGLSMPSPVCSV